MKKREKGILGIFVVLCITLPIVQGLAGISPGFRSVDFEPGERKEVTFDILGDSWMRFRVVPEGSLAEYVTITPRVLNGPGRVTVTLDFPKEIKQPGTQTIFISALQIPDKTQGIALIANIKGVIQVNIPYPEEFLSANLVTTDANAGQPVNLSLSIENFGNKKTTVNSIVNVYDRQKNLISTIPLGKKELESLEKYTYLTQIDTKGYLPGRYFVEADIQHGSGKNVKLNSSFRLGDLYVEILEVTRNFKRESLNKFDIEIESFWNEPIKDVYAKVIILDSNGLEFETNHITLESFGSSNLIGYFDTTTILEDFFRAKVILNYAGKTTEKEFELQFKNDSRIYLYILVAFILIVLLVLLFIWARRKKNERGK